MSTLWSVVLQLLVVSASLCPLLGLTVGSALHCAVRREISPCTCRHLEERPGSIQVTCERMTSFMQVVSALKDRFEEDITISLTISFSELEDLPLLSFQKLGLNVYNLKLNHDNLRYVNCHYLLSKSSFFYKSYCFFTHVTCGYISMDIK